MFVVSTPSGKGSSLASPVLTFQQGMPGLRMLIPASKAFLCEANFPTQKIPRQWITTRIPLSRERVPR